MFNPFFRYSGSSSTSLTFPFGNIKFLMLDLLAAINFSFKPPIDNTLPVSVISPVIAKLFFTGLSKRRDSRAVTIVIPAEGPSFGVAPSGI